MFHLVLLRVTKSLILVSMKRSAKQSVGSCPSCAAKLLQDTLFQDNYLAYRVQQIFSDPQSETERPILLMELMDECLYSIIVLSVCDHLSLCYFVGGRLSKLLDFVRRTVF